MWLTVCKRWRAVAPGVVVEAGQALVVATVSNGDVHGSAAAHAAATSERIPSHTLSGLCFYTAEHIN